MARDLYAALGRPRNEDEIRRDGRGPDVPLSRDATQEEVERAAMAAIRRHHPDHNPSDPDSAALRFRDAMLAREILCNPVRRKEYDDGQWIDPLDQTTSEVPGEPGWHKAVTDPARREVLTGVVEAACVLAGLDQDAAAMASHMTMGAVASAVEVANSPDPIAPRVTAALGEAAKKFTHPSGRAALREAGRQAMDAWRKVFG